MHRVGDPGSQQVLSVRVALAQINSTVGDLDGNTARIIDNIDKAVDRGADIVVFPELAVSGYPPEDLLLRPRFIRENQCALRRIAEHSHSALVAVGFVDSDSDVYNAAAILNNGSIVGIYHKVFLPNYGVFDENRYFRAGHECPVFNFGGIGIGVTICEDIWYEGGPASIQAAHGAEIILNLSASPYHRGKGDSRRQMLATRARDNVCVFAMCNLVGGQDELVFDGESMIVDEQGAVLAGAHPFEEDLVFADVQVESVFRARLHDPRWRKTETFVLGQSLQVAEICVGPTAADTPKPRLEPHCTRSLDTREEVYKALVLGTADYVRKNGFGEVVIGLSGGIDSTLVACIACDAMGPENVIGVCMPSRFTAAQSIEDAQQVARNLGLRLLEVPVEPAYTSFLDMLSAVFEGQQPDSTEENLQARIRGTILMSFSNKFRWLVLTTGNKSEMATGYTTLYGDMAGGFAVLKDVPKTLVYELAHHRNSLSPKPVIPQAVIERPPSAELRHNQKDSDSLPPYEVLDPILKLYVEDDRSVAQIIALGHDAETVEHTARLVDRSEYKRRQAPPGIKITTRAFGRDRRLPITNSFHG
ncbi:MAG: NAD+ synthase [Dehalococcoidia bacterium]|nr:MAG: NAD+ synthase [Dehalococcoidia bacterium]